MTEHELSRVLIYILATSKASAWLVDGKIYDKDEIIDEISTKFCGDKEGEVE